jgi:hypothetical protein
MFDHVFPIFAFGLVITGIVFLGLQQAADLAKDLAARSSEAGENSERAAPAAPQHKATPAQTSSNPRRP